MAEGRENGNRDFSFIQETIKQKRLYQSRVVRRIAWSVASGLLFALTTLAVWVLFVPGLEQKADRQEVQPVTLPEPEEEDTQNGPAAEEGTVYVKESVSMELEDYKKMYQELMQVGNQVEKSLVNVSALTVNTDWFYESFTSHSSVSGVLVEDNGMELLILTGYDGVEGGGKHKGRDLVCGVWFVKDAAERGACDGGGKSGGELRISPVRESDFLQPDGGPV